MVTKPNKTKPVASPATGSSLTVLNASDVDEVISQLDLELALESQQKVFTAFSNGSDDIQVPHRSTLTTPTQSTLVMPSRADNLLGCKFVGVPNEGSDGLSGTTVVLDDKSGKVKGVINARKLTALRNACGESTCPTLTWKLIIGSALSLRAVPPKREPRNLLIFGSGAQAYAHATVFLPLFTTLESCTIIVRTPTPRSEALLSDLKTHFPKITLTMGSFEDTSFNLSQAVHNANIILTLVPTTTPLFNSVDVTSGTHLVLVGSYKPEMRDVDNELIKRGGVIIVDSKEACLKEAGEIISTGLLSEDMVELGTILGKQGEDLRTVGDVTIFKSVSLLHPKSEIRGRYHTTRAYFFGHFPSGSR
jgi:ornithine cyclodeaminase/alanine dehydrogenase-like protein (mu-crystallin family)